MKVVQPFRPLGGEAPANPNSRGCLSLNIQQPAKVTRVDDHVAPINHVAAFIRPGSPERRVGRERSGTLTFSTAVVLEGSLAHSVCIRAVATHTTWSGELPYRKKKKRKSKRKERV